MEPQNYLGIYLYKNAATAVCLNPRGKDGSVVGCFSVSAEEQDQTAMQTLAGLIAQGCAERQWRFSEIAVALDCAMFMQHRVHSQFKDPKQIGATVKFDTEETLATDITNVALAFEVTASSQTGSELTVFTAERKILSDILTALQQHGLDPVTMEPDVVCLSRFIARQVASAGPQQAQALFGILSRHSGYLIVPPAQTDEASRRASAIRTFLVGKTQNSAALLAREVLMTAAMAEDTGAVRTLRLFDSTGALDYCQLGEKLGMEAGAIDLLQAAGAEMPAATDSLDPVDFAIAYGAALAHSQKGPRVDFRSDFSPFQGKKLRLQKALRFAAVSVTVLLMAVGLYFQTQLFDVNRDRSKVRTKFAKDYADVTLEKLPNAVTTKKAVADLEKLLRRVEAEQKGIGDKTLISSKLTLLLAAFKKCAAQTDLNISSITVTSKDILVSGDTSSRQNRQKIFETIRTSGLEILQERYDLVGSRENFSITIVPKI